MFGSPSAQKTVPPRDLCALGVSLLDFFSSVTLSSSISSAFFALFASQEYSTNSLESVRSALFCKYRGVGILLPIPFRKSVGLRVPLSPLATRLPRAYSARGHSPLTLLFPTHPKKSRVTPFLATLP